MKYIQIFRHIINLRLILSISGLAFVLALTTSLVSCARVNLVTSYFLIDYSPAADNPKLKLDKPLPYKAQVITFKIPRSFDSIRIIARFSSHQINYYRYNLWAVRPQVAVADLLVQHINSYQLFTKCLREFLDERPDYEFTGEIFQIERFVSEKYSAAHLKMAFEMNGYDSGELLVRHEFDRETVIPYDNMTIFAKAVSDMMDEEAEKFLEMVVDYFSKLHTNGTIQNSAIEQRVTD